MQMYMRIHLSKKRHFTVVINSLIHPHQLSIRLLDKACCIKIQKKPIQESQYTIFICKLRVVKRIFAH